MRVVGVYKYAQFSGQITVCVVCCKQAACFVVILF